MITIASTDPLNLTGIITPGKRLPAQSGYRIVYRDGKPIASNLNGELLIDDAVSTLDQGQIKSLLTRKHYSAAYHSAPENLV